MKIIKVKCWFIQEGKWCIILLWGMVRYYACWINHGKAESINVVHYRFEGWRGVSRRYCCWHLVVVSRRRWSMFESKSDQPGIAYSLFKLTSSHLNRAFPPVLVQEELVLYLWKVDVFASVEMVWMNHFAISLLLLHPQYSCPFEPN